ncbi:hypothetical protein [Streptomyces sp. NRRL F-2799]|uniref:hypothetical protein n=1 Tax=Streptomyces sp. NRRL F-2799 TaxID=1463844 RepID=UPI000D1400EC|nr:hypothetical protein [Streptomyces sp. NRRL F-2799]
MTGADDGNVSRPRWAIGTLVAAGGGCITYDTGCGGWETLIAAGARLAVKTDTTPDGAHLILGAVPAPLTRPDPREPAEMVRRAGARLVDVLLDDISAPAVRPNAPTRRAASSNCCGKLLPTARPPTRAPTCSPPGPADTDGARGRPACLDTPTAGKGRRLGWRLKS